MLSIVLDARGYDSLMRIAGKTLVECGVLERAQRIVGLTVTSPPIFVVRCDESEARSLLAAAEGNCPDAVHDIRLAINDV